MTRLLGEAYARTTVDREYLGVWDCQAAWQRPKVDGGEYPWLKENVVDDVDLYYIYRVEFYRHHEDEQDHTLVTRQSAVIYRFARHPETGDRYILRDDNGEVVRDEEGNSKAALLDPIEVTLKAEVPEDLR